MSYRQDISVGVEPVPAFYDLRHATWNFRVDGKSYAFDCFRMPFTLKDYAADKTLILKHGKEST